MCNTETHVQAFDRTKGPWKCFHCGETFTEYADAETHFGLYYRDPDACAPACVLKEERPLVQHIRRFEEATSKIWDILRDLEES